MKIKSLISLLMMWLVGSPQAFCGAISISPAALSLKGSPGRTITQLFEVSNSTDAAYFVDVDVQDVVVRQGKRAFVSSERMPDSLAALVSVPSRHALVQPGQSLKIPVTFVAPDVSRSRAVVVFFRASREHEVPNQPKIRLNLGTVVDFTVSNEVLLRVTSLAVEQQTNTNNVAITEELANVGPEPAIVRGVVAILSEKGDLVGKTEFQQKRLLPRESNLIRAEFPGVLKPGKYRAICTLEFADNAVTRTVELVVP